MRIIGIDPGTKNVGVAFYDNNIRTITLKKKSSGKLGLIELLISLTQEIQEFKPEFIIIEDYAHSSNFNKEESEFMGMFYYSLYKSGINCDICLAPITTIKSYISKGTASKSIVTKRIAELTGISKKELTSHSADATAILLLGIDYLSKKLSKDREKMLYNRTFNLYTNFFLKGDYYEERFIC